jgi:hypothetical protein
VEFALKTLPGIYTTGTFANFRWTGNMEGGLQLRQMAWRGEGEAGQGNCRGGGKPLRMG